MTSCILPQRNSNSVEKLIRYSFIHKGFLLIHEKLTDLSIYIAFLVSSLEQMNGTSYDVSIFCSTHFNHLLFLVNFPYEINPLSAIFTKWSNTLKQFVGKLPTHCLSLFDHFVGLALKRLKRDNKYNNKLKNFYP